MGVSPPSPRFPSPVRDGDAVGVGHDCNKKSNRERSPRPTASSLAGAIRTLTGTAYWARLILGRLRASDFQLVDHPGDPFGVASQLHRPLPLVRRRDHPTQGRDTV